MKIAKYTLLLIIIFSVTVSGQSQTLNSINDGRLNRSKAGMLVLGGWAAGNMILSPILRQQASGSDKYFYDMNLYWNAANLAIAGMGYLRASKEDPSGYSLKKSLKEQDIVEKVFLFNAGIDFAYIASGLYLNERGKNKNSNELRGYGQAVILQGAFLLVFDVIMYSSHRKGSKALHDMVEGLSIGANGIGMRIKL